jgi:hypothetical protein
LKFKLLILLICAIAWAWIVYNFKSANTIKQANFTVCLFKLATNYPCPSCGTTRSAIYFLHGNFLKALLLNPLGILGVFLLFFLPAVISIDYFFSKNILLKLQTKFDAMLSKRVIVLILIGLLILNWIWNILKHL